MLKDRLRLMLTLRCLGRYHPVVKKHSAVSVCKMLKLLECGDDMFWYVTNAGELIPWTAKKLLTKSSGTYFLADGVAPLEFIGGPTGDTLYTGSLSTFLIDRMLRYVLADGLISIRAIAHILQGTPVCS